MENGTQTLNGNGLNGHSVNGHSVNGCSLNGKAMKGKAVNGVNGKAEMATNGQNGNGHTMEHSGASSCCRAEMEYDQHFQEGMEFLHEALDMCMNDGVPQALGRERQVVDFVEPSSMAQKFKSIWEEGATSKEKMMAVLRDVLKYSVKTGHPYFYNQLYGGMEPYSMAGALVSDLLNASQYTYEVAPVFTVMEKALFTEVIRIIGFPSGDGIFCPGGSISNLYALNLARFKAFPDVKTKGMRSLPEMCLAISEKGHYSTDKAAATLGLGMDNVMKIKTDQWGKMIPEDLDRRLTEAKDNGMVPISVTATAGTTVQGAYDPIQPIADICKKHGVWLHVDAAWGGAVLLSDTLRTKMDGVERADSVTWNLHKMIGAPQQTSMFVTRHTDLLKECHSAKARYLFQQDKFYDVSWDTGDKSLQCGRKVDVLKAWFMWKAKGSKRLGEEVEHIFHCAQYLLKKLQSRPDIKMVNSKPQCTNVCFWYIPPRLQNKEETSDWWQEVSKVAPKIKERMVMKGSLLIGYQPEDDHVNFFRFVLSNLAVKLEDMDYLVEEISRLGQDL